MIDWILAFVGDLFIYLVRSNIAIPLIVSFCLGLIVHTAASESSFALVFAGITFVATFAFTLSILRSTPD